jgi:hypothetical protein
LHTAYLEWPEIRRGFITLAFKLCSEHAIRRVQENQEGLIPNGTHQLLTYDEEVNIVGENIDAIQKKIQKLH